MKRLHRGGGRTALFAENPGNPPLERTEGSERVSWDRVIGKFSCMT